MKSATDCTLRKSGWSRRLLAVCFVLLWTATTMWGQSASAGQGATNGAGTSGTTSGQSVLAGQATASGASPSTATASGPGASTNGSFALPTGPTGVLGGPTPAPAAALPVNAPVIGVSVDGSNVTSGEMFTVPPTPVADTSDPLTVTITNGGDTTLELDKYAPPALYGDASMMYLIDYSTYTPAIDPGETTSFTVTFFPYQTGEDDATLVIISNDPRTPQFVVNFAGRGLPMSNATDAGSQTYGAQGGQ